MNPNEEEKIIPCDFPANDTNKKLPTVDNDINNNHEEKEEKHHQENSTIQLRPIRIKKPTPNSTDQPDILWKGSLTDMPVGLPIPQPLVDDAMKEVDLGNKVSVKIYQKLTDKGVENCLVMAGFHQNESQFCYTFVFLDTFPFLFQFEEHKRMEDAGLERYPRHIIYINYYTVDIKFVQRALEKIKEEEPLSLGVGAAFELFVRLLQAKQYFYFPEYHTMDAFPRAFGMLLHRLNNNAPYFRLNLNHWPLNDEHVHQLMVALQNNQTIQSIDLRNNNIKIKGLYHITSFLTKNKKVMEIKLEGNPVEADEKGHRIIHHAIIPFLQHRRGEEIHCETVDLHDCRADMVKDIFLKNLEYYIGLMSLNLSHLDQPNEFFFPVIIDDLFRHQSSKIQYLDLSYNKILDDALYELSDAMRGHDDVNANKTLQTIDLSHNKICVNKSTLEERENIFKNNPMMKGIDLSANYLLPDCDVILNNPPILQEEKTIENHISNNQSSLYFSRKINHNVKSILNPEKTLRVYGKDAWVVALCCYKGAKHACVFLEKLLPSGQRELIKCEIKADDNGEMKTNVETFDHKMCNIDEWDKDDYYISSAKGDMLYDRINKEKKDNIIHDYTTFPITKITPKKKEKVNCTTWCIKRMQAVKVPITESSIFSKIPRLAANKNKPENQPFYQRWLSKIGF